MIDRLRTIAACLTILSLSARDARAETERTGVALVAVSGADGTFETVTSDGATGWRTIRDGKGAYSPFLYLRLPDSAPRFSAPVYLEVRYKDLGAGRLSVQYNALGKDDYRAAERGFGRLLTGQGANRTAVFELIEPDFRHAQNLGADLRLHGPDGDAPLHVIAATLHARAPEFFRERAARPWLQPYDGPRRADIDATTLRGKVLCGYQGWFRCPGDDTETGWGHWGRDSSRIAPETLTFEMWPDMTDYTTAERYPVPGFHHEDGTPAFLFSAANPKTVDRHFDWMRTYGIDGVFVQRFVVGQGRDDPAESARVLGSARDAANRSGRVFAVDYDMTGTPPDQVYDRLVSDWKWLVETLKITDDPRYLHHDGRPVLAIFGFYSDRMPAATAHRIIDFFKDDPKYRVALVGGCPWYWRTEKDPEWARAYRRFAALKPWNVGNYRVEAGVKHASTRHWEQDLAEAKRAGMLFLPVIYPGFSWDNLKRKPPGTTTIPRLGGAFYREQFAEAARLGLDAAFVAMFDEVDEGTAIFKVTNSPPKPGRFVTFENQPSDWYLRLTGEGTRLLHGRR